MHCLHGIHILLAGGDRREFEIYRIWAAAGLSVKLYGLPGYSEILPPAAYAGKSDFGNIKILIFPVCGIEDDGTVPAPGGNLAVISLLAKLPAGLIILAGSVAPPWKKILQHHGRLIETAADEELALLNAVPTAEGAVAEAMVRSDITVHGSRALVMGLGRCGAVLAQTLQGLGAEVSVLVRRREKAALALTRGWRAVPVADLPRAVQQADFIFNTIPAPVLTADLLEQVQPETLILDIASLPGGIDRAAAERLQLRAYCLPGLPGRIAPRSAGRILAGIYEKLICRHLQ